MQEFDSKEELHFSWYLETLKQWNYINHWYKCEDSYQLTYDVYIEYLKPMKRVADKVMKQTLLKGRSYTPDFVIDWNQQAINKLATELKIDCLHYNKITTPFISQANISFVEVKGTFDNNNMTRLANNNIKDVYAKYGDYINLIKVPNIFKKTFTPERYLLTDKSLKPRKVNWDVRSIKEFINSLPE
jgi:hypothetical protein